MRGSLERRAVLAVLALALASSQARAQDSATAGLVTELVGLMAAAEAQSIAAPLPGREGSYVGALYFAGSQLLVVSARYSVPQLLDEKIAAKSYQEVYIDLNSASVPGTKVFVSDLGVDGLKARRRANEPFDTVEIAGKSVAFDGDWKKASLSEAEYMTTFAAAEKEYTQMLQALIAQLKKAA
ncbi:MAG: hypothetical protein FJW23_05780 [Acidimicrobiia bacterium]|nr:hypothetical protein [Acidimicrobiia bacterium]